MRPEPFNPFDTGDKVCFPDIEEGLALDVGPDSPAAAVVDIEQLSRYQPADINTAHAPDLGYLPLETSQLLEARCQAWFDVQSSLKALRVGIGFHSRAVATEAAACYAWLCSLSLAVNPHTCAAHSLHTPTTNSQSQQHEKRCHCPCAARITGRLPNPQLPLHPARHPLQIVFGRSTSTILSN